MVGKRRRAREAALQILYQIDMGGLQADEAINNYWEEKPFVDEEIHSYATRLVKEAVARLEEIDKLIDAVLENWEIERVAAVDRNILRLGVCELLAFEDVPPKVTINEAVEIAKRFSTEESGRFVNGVLDAIWKRLERANLCEEGKDGKER